MIQSQARGWLRRDSDVSYVIFAGVLLFICVGFVALMIYAGFWHADNLELCTNLGGTYDAFDGTGQCIKDQVILFDPKHPWKD